MANDCLICERISMIQEGNNPYFVAELETGYVVIGDFQTYKGYTVFLCKRHCSELHLLKPRFRQRFLSEMAIVAEAVYKTFKPDKLNYELLGNTGEHMHWHLFPRRKSDEKSYTAIWAVNKTKRSARPSDSELSKLRQSLKTELKKLRKYYLGFEKMRASSAKSCQK